MSTNDNGFPIVAMSYSSSIPSISEGDVIGISMGWIFGTTLLYILGLLGIRWFLKVLARKEESSQSSSAGSSGNRQRKTSGSEEPSANIDHSNNPTLQMINLGTKENAGNVRRR
jgi:Ca2+/Na+ antiporter